MSARNTTGAIAQYWAVTASGSPQANGNIAALWLGGGSGSLVLQGADGAAAFTLVAPPLNTWIIFPYAIQIVSSLGSFTGVVAAGWGAPNNG